jgi:hypothetical protein
VIPQTLVNIENFSESQRPGALYHAKFRRINNQKSSTYACFFEFGGWGALRVGRSGQPAAEVNIEETNRVDRDLYSRWADVVERAQCFSTKATITGVFTG